MIQRVLKYNYIIYWPIVLGPVRLRHQYRTCNCILLFFQYYKNSCGTNLGTFCALSYIFLWALDSTYLSQGQDILNLSMCERMNIERISQSISILEKQMDISNSTPAKVLDYEVDNVSEKICRIIHSYTDYVNRVIWKKY